MPDTVVPAESDLPSREFKPFNPSLIAHGPSGAAVRYLEDALAQRYLMPVPRDWRQGVPAGMLPPQDLELRKELDRWRGALEVLNGFGLMGRLARRTDYKQALARADLHERRVRALMRKSREHFSAARRIVVQEDTADPVYKPLLALVQSESGSARR